MRSPFEWLRSRGSLSGYIAPAQGEDQPSLEIKLTHHQRDVVRFLRKVPGLTGLHLNSVAPARETGWFSDRGASPEGYFTIELGATYTPPYEELGKSYLLSARNDPIAHDLAEALGYGDWPWAMCRGKPEGERVTYSPHIAPFYMDTVPGQCAAYVSYCRTPARPENIHAELGLRVSLVPREGR